MTDEFDLDTSAATRLLDVVSQIFDPVAVTDVMLFAAERVAVAAEELMPGASSQRPYPPQTHNELPLYYDRMSAPVYKYKTVNGERVKTNEILKPAALYKSKFKSLAQQRKVMALYAEGAIPYRRTGTLGKSFTHSAPIVSGPGIVSFSVGTNLEYAPYVVGAALQSHYHKDNWPIVETLLAEHVGELEAVAVAALIYDVRRRIRNAK